MWSAPLSANWSRPCCGHERVLPRRHLGGGVEPRLHHLQGGGAVEVEAEVLLARADQLDGPPRLAGDHGRLEHRVGLEPAPEAAAQVMLVDPHLGRLHLEHLREEAHRHGLELAARVQIVDPALEARDAVHRLHLHVGDVVGRIGGGVWARGLGETCRTECFDPVMDSQFPEVSQVRRSAQRHASSGANLVRPKFAEKQFLQSAEAHRSGQRLDRGRTKVVQVDAQIAQRCQVRRGGQGGQAFIADVIVKQIQVGQ